MKLNQLYFKNSEEEIELEDLSELNKILNADFITQNNDFDFQILIDNGFFKLESSLGESSNKWVL